MYYLSFRLMVTAHLLMQTFSRFDPRRLRCLRPHLPLSFPLHLHSQRMCSSLFFVLFTFLYYLEFSLSKTGPLRFVHDLEFSCASLDAFVLLFLFCLCS